MLFPVVQPAHLRLPAIFGSHMVLARSTSVKIWGWEEPGARVSVQPSWLTRPIRAKAERSGVWAVTVRTLGDTASHSIAVRASTTINLQDVVFGDVWVCSGQSNMEWPMTATDHAAEDIAGAKNRQIRLFQVENVMSSAPQPNCSGKWMVCSPESVKGFSAVGYFFGKEVQSKTGRAVGLIDTTWGGTEAELWTSEAGLNRLPDFAKSISSKQKAAASYEADHRKWEQDMKSKDPGYSGWFDPALDDSSWTKTDLKPWSQVEALKNHDGSCWYRAEFDAPEQWAGKEIGLQVGQIDDDETTWVNGVEVGSTRGWNVNRAYTIPGKLVKAGKNIVAVRVWDAVGEGGWSTPERACNVYRGDALTAMTDWRYRIGKAKSSLPAEPTPPNLRNSLLYNGMIHPLLSIPIKGAIWYQGEANVGRAAQYRQLFPAMIQDWRRAWGAQLPFYFVQIAPFSGYGSSAAAELREAQNEALKLKHTGVAVVTDAVSNVQDIHPQDKRTVGHRLALWALSQDYGMRGLEHSGPLFRSAEFSHGKAVVTFSHAGGLVARGGALREFELAGADRAFHPATAVVAGESVVVTSSSVPHPVAVRMGWSTAPNTNLFNDTGLPASPFRSDRWPGLTDKARW